MWWTGQKLAFLVCLDHDPKLLSYLGFVNPCDEHVTNHKLVCITYEDNRFTISIKNGFPNLTTHYKPALYKLCQFNA